MERWQEALQVLRDVSKSGFQARQKDNRAEKEEK